MTGADVGFEALVEQALAEPSSNGQRRGGEGVVDAKGIDHDDRPAIEADIGDLALASRLAQRALQKANDPPRYFSHGGELVRIETDDDGRPFTRPLGPHRLMHHLARAAQYIKVNRKGEVTECRPPMDVVHDLLASPERMWPALRRIVSVPVFADDGTICQEPGYNPAARAWYHPGSLVLGEIPAQPSGLDVAQAVDLITETITDFPFVDDADQAHALSMMIQPFARDLIAGPTPMYLARLRLRPTSCN